MQAFTKGQVESSGVNWVLVSPIFDPFNPPVLYMEYHLHATEDGKQTRS